MVLLNLPLIFGGGPWGLVRPRNNLAGIMLTHVFNMFNDCSASKAARFPDGSHMFTLVISQIKSIFYSLVYYVTTILLVGRRDFD